MTIELREEGALIDSVKPGYYGCDCGYGCSGGGGCNCTGDTPTPPGPEPPTPDTGITSIHIIVADTITDSGRASAVFTPATADTSLYFSSSDEDIAEIDPDTGEITVIQTGVVTFCVEDLLTGLEDCKIVNVIKSVEPTRYRIKLVFDVTSTTIPTTVVNRHSNVVKAELENGTEIPLGDKVYVDYVFPQTGRNIVYLTLDDPKLIHYMFCAFDLSERTTERLVEVELGEGITEIAAIAFESNSMLTSITIPNSVVYIGDKAFLWADLRKIVLPGVRSIGYSAFMGNANVEYADIGPVVPPVLDLTYGDVFQGNYPIYVPSSSVNTYKTNSDWSVYESRIQPKP